ncbi:MAG: beta-ketoadipyl CoA thiolase [Deltaproteobacteria bacterium CG2_30_63_29]|nr:MAG: beta-ketoadipyl CoA thiolase [Deltaproteobacteria bacterium CG2_30_63_29]PJB49274.1 MAG: acetyl-CoA C-acyltransferase [Deltaproteobacteria bacterium CG_4_9_14_3_um_filter_63_12]
MSKQDIVLLSAKRTPFGALNGALDDQSATDLGVVAGRAAIAAAGIEPAQIDQVIFGNVLQTSTDAIYLARHIGLRCELPIDRPALTVNRLCGSGFQSIVGAAEQILLGYAKVVLAGGTESMSQAPHALYKTRAGFRFGLEPKLIDTLWASLTDSYTQTPMAMTAENLAVNYGISREDVDAYALLSQQRWAAADGAGVFEAELAPIELSTRKGPISFDKDEHPRPSTTLESLGKLRPVFKKDGVVTAGNASGICDGGGALVVASREAAEALGKKPLARVVSWGIVGVEPTLMGIGPVEAAKQALARAGLTLAQMDLVEVNEAFSAQYIAVEKALGLDREKTNVNGGAIALGHPLAASGSRIMAHLVHELRRRGARYGLGSACIGGGQGIAMIIEAL